MISNVSEILVFEFFIKLIELFKIKFKLLNVNLKRDALNIEHGKTTKISILLNKIITKTF